MTPRRIRKMQTTSQSTNPLAIRRGKITRPQKVVIYGPEGVGKSTLAGQTPEPVFLDTEGGTHHLDVARLDAAATWEEITATVTPFDKRSDKRAAAADPIRVALAIPVVIHKFFMSSEGCVEALDGLNLSKT